MMLEKGAVAEGGERNLDRPPRTQVIEPRVIIGIVFIDSELVVMRAPLRITQRRVGTETALKRSSSPPRSGCNSRTSSR